MTFISYAQNYEDLMLWRALKHVERGTYIDVGANDPTIDSVTCAFYKQGWHGINIEPLHIHFDDLVRERPHDINLLCAVGSSSGEAEIWECDVRGWATLSKKIVEQHTAEGHMGVFHKVPMFTLTEICTKYVTGEIHFLKIDVEGLEKSVLEGMNFSIFRPWIVVVEAIKPNTTIEVYQEWEDLLLKANYCLAYKDGINRFYLAQEHEELLASFEYPPNMLDNFIRFDHMESELRSRQVDGLLNQLKETQAALTARDTALAEQQAHSQWLQNEWNAGKARLEHLAGELALSQARAGDLESQLAVSRAALTARATALAEQQAHSQWLQNEWNAGKARLEHLAGELALSQARAGDLESQLAVTRAALTARDAALAEQQAHSQWLQNEWNAAKAEINELNHSSHHWWIVADEINRELQSILKSKFWRITWPLRKMIQFFKWLVFLPIRLLRWIIRLPRRAARWLLAKIMTFAIKHPGLSLRSRHWLSRYPKLKFHLRLFAQKRGLISPPIESQAVPEDIQSFSTADLNSVPPRVRQIYANLKTEIEKRKVEQY
jgi:FkbM family methyltransferase